MQPLLRAVSFYFVNNFAKLQIFGSGRLSKLDG